MSNYSIHRGSFIAPVKRRFADGRRQLDIAIRKLHRGEPAAMQKRAETAEIPSSFGENADETLQEIKKLHRAGRRAGLPQHTAQGDVEVGSKSVSMVKRAHAHALPVTDNRMLSVSELSKAFAEQVGRIEVDLDTLQPHRGYATGFRAMTAQELRKAAGRPRSNDTEVTDNYNHGAPESANSNWNSVHANTGAANDWHDQIAPSTKPARVAFHQFGTPGQSSRDDAIEAIKQDLSKPKRMGGASPNIDDSFRREQ
jgi:hypothetical protein